MTKKSAESHPDFSSSPISRRTFLQKLGAFVAGHRLLTGLGAGTIGTLAWSEHDTLKLEENHWDLSYPDLPSSLNNKTILHLSDLHLESLQFSPDRILKAVSTFSPDLIVFTGDLISTRTDLDKVEKYLEPLHAIHGKYFVMGNNDYSHFSNALFKRYLECLHTLGWNVLCNDAAYLSDLGLMIIGVDDPATARDNTEQAYLQSQKLLSSSPAPSSTSQPFRLVLAHSTDCIDDVIRQGGADLMLTGHTHGGQIRIPGMKPFITNTYLGQHGIYEGYHQIDGIPVYISRGIGTSKIPFRLGALPEITCFTLHQESASHTQR